MSLSAMRLTLPTVVPVLPLFIVAAPRRVKLGGTAIPLVPYKHSSLVNADKSVKFEALKSHAASTGAKFFVVMITLSRTPVLRIRLL
ncbi:hypothetical protein BS17DRAFT_785388 [Gyrodon lividus]|nr:hypothetical protein BS17DRAFT_785388 [Gyrodon lividus]